MPVELDEADYYIVPADMRILNGAHCAGIENYALTGPIGPGALIVVKEDSGPLGWVAVVDGRKVAGGIIETPRSGRLRVPRQAEAHG
jgi:hypothetical protein